MPSARRGAHHDGSRRCVRRQEPQRARCGRSRAVAPPSSRITRSRPCPYRRSLPVPHDGQASSPPARSADAAAASAHSSTVGLPDHDSHDLPARHTTARGNSCCTLPGQAPARNPNCQVPRKTTPWPPAGSGLAPRPAPSHQMLTVTSRTKTDTRRRPGIGTLTTNDANPLARTQKERRGTGTLPAQIRGAAHSVGLAWQYLAAANGQHHPVTGAAAGPAADLCAAAARAISAWSRPDATVQDSAPIRRTGHGRRRGDGGHGQVPRREDRRAPRVPVPPRRTLPGHRRRTAPAGLGLRPHHPSCPPGCDVPLPATANLIRPEAPDETAALKS